MGHSDEMSEPYVTTGTAARAIGVSLTTLQRWANAGRVQPAIRTAGGHFRWDLDSLRAQLRALDAREGRMTEPADKPEPQPVVAAIVTSDLGVLVGRRNDGKPPWTFIAGEIEPGESPADAAVREVKEETGCLISPDKVIGRRVHPRTGRTMIYIAARPVHGTKVFVGDSEELAEVRWISLREADELLPGMYEPVRDYLVREFGTHRGD
jgi:8-oxo-dGTP pyrophosphatase MutT (NUDIX family)